MNIAILFKENYLKAAETLMYSLAKQTDMVLTVFLLYNDISEKKIEKFRQFVKDKCHGLLCEIKVDASLFDEMPLNTHFTQETYFRLLMPELLPDSVERILYLDVDMIVRYPLDTLYEMDFEDQYAIVCPSRWEPMRLEEEKLPLSKTHIYFNTGVMLYNMKKIREENTRDFLICCMKEYKEKLRYLDQDVLNIAFCDKVKYVDYRIYDMQVVSNERITTNELNKIKEQAAVIHYLGDVKPWNMKKYYANPLKGIYLKCAAEKGNLIEIFQLFVIRPILIVLYYFLDFVKRRVKRYET